jgi:CRISPR-associated protein Cst1
MKDVVIYPSSWYYNACVQGFLEVLAYGLGEQIVTDEFLQNDGTVKIPGDLMEAVFCCKNTPMPNPYCERVIVPEEVADLKRIAWWWVEKSYDIGYMKKDDRGKPLKRAEFFETVIRSLFHKSAPYPNLTQVPWPTERKKAFINDWFRMPALGNQWINCAFCDNSCNLEPEQRTYDNYFTRSLSIELGSGPDVFPNSFWDGHPNMAMCKLCRSYFLCFHITSRKNSFINADSFRINWFLNRVMEGHLNRGDWQSKLMDSLYYDSQMRTSISSWGMQSIEIVVFGRDGVNCFPVNADLARMLILPGISSLVNKINHKEIWKIILSQQYDYLLTVIYKSLRGYLSGSNKGGDPEVIMTYGGRPTQINHLIDLFGQISLYLRKGGLQVKYVDYRELRKAANEAPIDLSDNRGKGNVYRIMELARLGKKAEVYHLLLRQYISSGRTFPPALAWLFEIEDDALFKNGIYAYLAALRNQEKAEVN